MARKISPFVLILILADIATAFIFNDSLEDFDNALVVVKTRRQGKAKPQSTSSSEARKGEGEDGEQGSSAESLRENLSGQTSTDTDEKKRVMKDRAPKSTAERTGWRKWHRKCTTCREDMRKKWRDPSIKWICGAYQRARRTFKSLCMMHYRNCQDGTMFTKIADHRCPNATRELRPYGQHFFYDYKVTLTDDSDDSEAEITPEDDKDSSSSWDTSMIAKLPSASPSTTTLAE